MSTGHRRMPAGGLPAQQVGEQRLVIDLNQRNLHAGVVNLPASVSSG